MPPVEPQMLKGVLALLLLRLVAAQEDYGYSLVQRLRAAGLTDAAEGSVYPALARLEARGLLVPRMVREGRGPGRRYYSPSAAGLEEAARLQQSWEAVGAAVRATAPGADGAAGAAVDGAAVDDAPVAEDAVVDDARTGPGRAPVPIRGG